MSKSDRAKRAEQTMQERFEKLRASGFSFSSSGRTLEPGTREYERELKHFVSYLSAEELEGILAELEYHQGSRTKQK